ncbi:hypothetical protein SNE40_000982 [Patella caerulea]
MKSSMFQLSWISSISGGGTSAFSHLAGIVIHRYGYRKAAFIGTILISGGNILSYFATDYYYLYITMGFMIGLGLAFINMSSLIIIYDYFYLKRAVAMSIANAGLSVGNFIFPYIVNYLIEEYGWRGCSLLIGGFFLNGLWCCLVFKPQNPSTIVNLLFKDKTESRNTKEVNEDRPISLLKDALFYKCVISQFIIGICCTIYVTYLPLLSAEQFGEGDGVGTFLLSIVGIGSLIGRVIFGLVVNKWSKSATLVYAACAMGCGLCYQIVTFCNSIPPMFVVTTGEGIFNGGFSTMATMMFAQNFGMEKLHLTCGIAYTFAGLATFAGSPLAAIIIDLSGNIETAYLVNGALFIISGLIIIPTGFKLVYALSKKNEKSAFSFMNVWTTDVVLFI